MTVQSSGMASVMARMSQIQARFGALQAQPAAQSRTASGANPDFAAALAGANAAYDTGGSTKPAVDGNKVIVQATKYLGVPYRWGGTDPETGLDCSGFVQQVFEDLGVSLPRVSRDQATAGTPVADMALAKAGDLIAFGDPVDHIGIYCGDGRMIVAPRTGDVVKFQDVPSDWTAIRRVLPEPQTAAAAPSWSGATGGVGGGRFDALFQSAAARYGVPADLLASVAKHESGFDPRAVSHAGAQGLMQLMPGTARGLGVDPFDPAQAVDGAARLLSGHLNKYGSLDLALAAYNAGPGAVDRYGGVPPYRETQTYVQRILADLRPEAR